MERLSTETIKIITDLQNDLDDLLKYKSNIEVIWKLEELHNNKAFLQSANYIRKSLNN